MSERFEIAPSSDRPALDAVGEQPAVGSARHSDAMTPASSAGLAEPIAIPAPPSRTRSARKRATPRTQSRVHIERGAIVMSRLYDIGYGVNLDRAARRFAAATVSRPAPFGAEAQAIQIANTPLVVDLGSLTLLTPEREAPLTARMSARIYDFGAVSLRLRVEAPAGIAWSAYTAVAAQARAALRLRDRFAPAVDALVAALGDAIERPSVASVTEDYIVFRISGFADATGRPLPVDVLDDNAIAMLLLDESRPLAAGAVRDLLPHRFSYYHDDLAVPTWESALVVSPGLEETDTEYVLEFTNAQLLELRFYDALLDREMPGVYEQVGAARNAMSSLRFRNRYTKLLRRLHTLYADTTEVMERIENALKVTDDVYLARVYSAALDIFRGRAWRSGVDRKLRIVRETYEMLNAEATTSRSHLMELAIVFLIVLEIVLAV